MRHNSSPENTTGLVQAIGLDNGTGGEIALEDLPDAGMLDQGELDAKADDDAQDQEEDEELKDAEAFHGAVWAVKDEDGHDVEDGQGTARNKGKFGDEEVQGDCCSNDLEQKGVSI